MPRIKRRSDQPSTSRRSSTIVQILANELKSERTYGQPVIEEEEFGITGRIRVLVIWDRWQKMPHEERSSTILSAYRITESNELADRITLATGLTFPEAISSGMLPCQVIAALRKGDLVTAEQCRQAMIEEGASTLVDPQRPQLRFATEEDAEEAMKRLSNRLPHSQEVWQLIQDAGPGVEIIDDLED